MVHTALRLGSMLVPYAAFSVALLAQDSDIAVFRDNGRSFTILSEIENPAERRDFLAALNANEPAVRHRLAETFINTYPRSWLLGQAYDLCARSSIDLGEYESALQEGRFSLRLLPENSILLVLLSNLEAQRDLFDDAVEHGANALELLDSFSRPGNFTDDQWRAVKPRLKASAYFAIGRAQAAKGMQAASRDLLDLKKALDNLNHAAAWNSSDPEIFYLRALVEIRLHDTTAASADLAFVARSSSTFSSQAQAALEKLSGAEPFERFLSQLPRPAIDSHLRTNRNSETTTMAIQAGYAGSQACRACHPHEYETWRTTGMSRMLEEYKSEKVKGDFSVSARLDDRINRGSVRLGRTTRPYMEIRGADGNWRRFFVDYTIGSKWQQAYATRDPDGALYVFPIQYNFEQRAWINYWALIDPPDSDRVHIEDFPKLSSVTNYQENCAVCHTSQLRTGPAGDSMMHARFREPGVDCEMCHGPSALHISKMRNGRFDSKALLEPPLDFRKIDNRMGVRVCAQCHRQSAIRQIGAQQEMNYSAQGADFIQTSWSRPYDAFSRRAFFKDGRFRETTFIVEAFTRSACYRKGTAQCATCHAPHLANFSQNMTSLKFKENPQEMCLQCHGEYRRHITEHTHHPANSEGSECVSCHMPRIVNALLFKARSHQIEIPTADLTERFGQDESPNACLICHSEKDARWARSGLERWRN